MRGSYGLFELSSGTLGSLTVRNCTFESNSVGSVSESIPGYGGILYSYPLVMNVFFEDCSFINTSATMSAGTMSVDISEGNVTIKNCTFWETQSQLGGLFYLTSSTRTNMFFLANSTIINASSTSSGGVLVIEDLARVFIINCLISVSFVTKDFVFAQ